MIVLTLGAVTVRVFPETRYLETIFTVDGSKVPAAANDDPDTIARAHDLGYTSDDPTWRMARDHEVLHTVLAQARGLPYSPTLWYVAHGMQHPAGTADPDAALRALGDEEALVMATHRLLYGRPFDAAVFARHGLTPIYALISAWPVLDQAAGRSL